MSYSATLVPQTRASPLYLKGAWGEDLRGRKFSSFIEAAALILNDMNGLADLQGALLAVAGPVSSDRCVLTNCSWVIDAQDFYDGFRVKARIVNDFEAVAYSLPFLGSADLAKIGGGEDG